MKVVHSDMGNLATRGPQSLVCSERWSQIYGSGKFVSCDSRNFFGEKRVFYCL